MCPPKCSCRCEMIARVEATESCWPATWKMSVPKASSGGSSSIQARGERHAQLGPERAQDRRHGVLQQQVGIHGMDAIDLGRLVVDQKQRRVLRGDQLVGKRIADRAHGWTCEP